MISRLCPLGHLGLLGPLWHMGPHNTTSKRLDVRWWPFSAGLDKLVRGLRMSHCLSYFYDLLRKPGSQDDRNLVIMAGPLVILASQDASGSTMLAWGIARFGLVMVWPGLACVWPVLAKWRGLARGCRGRVLAWFARSAKF